MNYIAHCDGEREQSILEHLQGTAEKAKDFAEVFEKGDWGYCCGMLHDIGKYSDKFQRRIRGEEIKVDHATAGARVCMELGGMYPFLEMCIAGHHAGLSDYGVSTDTGNSSTTLGRRKKKIEDFYAYKKEVKIPELKTSPVNVEKTKDLNFSLSMFTRMMYSCLVDADFLDTEEFMTEERSGRQQGQEIQVLLDKLEKYITEWLKNTETESVNGRRTEILKACLENGEREKGLFRLTVPTGGGKTVASLAFALRHAVKHHMKRTSMYPKHRKRMLKQIKERLREGKKCIVISTSLVEAGVDLDFYTVYRQLSGIDSIIQAAGRCNREGKRTIEESKVVIFQFDDAEKVPGQRQQMDVSKALLANECKIEDMQTVTRYFEMLYHMRGESLDKKKICEEFNGGWHHFATVEREFKLIDENTVTVFVNQEEDAQEVIQDLKNKGFTKSGMRRAVQYCVNLYKQEFEKYNDAGMLKLVSEDIKDFYELTDLEQYSEETGLNLEVDCGMAVWL